MSRKPPIKWRDSDAEKLAKEVERFNAKIYRTRSKHPELADILPKTIKKEDKLRMIQEFKVSPRSDFIKEMNSIARFSRRGAEQKVENKQGVKTTKWEKKEISIATAQLNRDRARERNRINEIEVTSRGESVGQKRGEMGSVRMNELNSKTFNFDNVRSKRELEKFKDSVKNQASAKAKAKVMDDYKLNYIKSIYRVYGEQGESLIELIKQLPSEIVTETYYQEQESDITFNYHKADNDAKFEIIEKIWNKVANENKLSKDNWNSNSQTTLNEWYERGW